MKNDLRLNNHDLEDLPLINRKVILRGKSTSVNTVQVRIHGRRKHFQHSARRVRSVKGRIVSPDYASRVTKSRVHGVDDYYIGPELLISQVCNTSSIGSKRLCDQLIVNDQPNAFQVDIGASSNLIGKKWIGDTVKQYLSDVEWTSHATLR